MADVYGAQEQFDDAVDKVKAQIDALIIAMSSDSPKISYCYKGHNTVPVLLNGVTVDFDGADTTIAGKASGDVLDYHIFVTIRVHTDYAGGYCDGEKVTRLLNSIDNYLNTHRDLGNSYRIWEISDYRSFLDFVESGTIGGQMRVNVQYILEHQQA